MKIYTKNDVLRILFFFWAMLFILFPQANLKAQTNAIINSTIEGRILDSLSKLPLEGVTVQLKSVTHQVKTNAGGYFKIVSGQKLPANVQISSIGYFSKNITIANSPTTIFLSPKSDLLNELVVVGYGQQSKKDVTGSIARISGNAIKDIPVQSFDQALAGKAAGVSVSLPNGLLNNPPVIRIRGINSISLSSFPLVVVDGIPINSGDLSSNSSVQNNALSLINPSDIESIDVLKDAASTSIYGSRGAAGVLIVTTKKGSIGKTKLNYDFWTGLNSDTRFPDLLNAEQYIDLKNEAVLNAKILKGEGNNNSVASKLFFPSYNEDGSIIDTKWKDYIYRTGVSHNHNLAISGGTNATTFFVSGNYTDQQGFFVGNDFNRLGLRANASHKITDWFKISINSTFQNSKNKSYNSGSVQGTTTSTTGAGRLALALPPNVPAYNVDGSYFLNTTGGQLGSGNNQLNFPLFNPVALFDLNRNTAESNRFIGNISAEVKILKNLIYSTTYAIDYINAEDVAFKSRKYGSDAFSTKGSVQNTTSTRHNSVWTNLLNYTQAFGDHHLGVLLGGEIQKYDSSTWGIRATNASDDFFEYIQGGWGTIEPGTRSLGERVFVSYFSRINYDFKNRYFLTANFRKDGNSALAVGSKYGNFGGVSAGWQLSNENFYQSSSLNKIVNSVKITGSWGRVGNGNLNNDYSSYALYSSALYGAAPTWSLNQVGNQLLSWETSDQSNIGLNLGFLNNRIQTEIAYFNNNVNGLILNTPLSPSMGIPGNSILANVGSLYNRGIEIGINASLIRKTDFSWDASFNYSNIRNKVTALANNEDIIGYTSTNLNNTNITRVGESVGSLYGAISAGVNPENGRRIFINGAGEKVQYSFAVAPGESNWTYLDGKTAKALTAVDFRPLGNALPKWYGGFTNNFRYKSFDLNLTLTYAGGNHIMNGTKTTLRDQIFFNNSTDMLRRWTAQGQETDIPRLVYNDRISNGTQFSISENVEKGDFLRVQNILLGYRLPAEILSRIHLSSLRFYVQATNPLLFTKYGGVDPEVSTNGNSNLTPGVDFNSVGQARTFTLGLNLEF